jgi:hypothetical protein
MFPNYKKKWFWNVPDNWKDLGNYGNYFDDIMKKCSFCGEVVRIGRESDNVFMFCPRCMKKLGVKTKGL